MHLSYLLTGLAAVLAVQAAPKPKQVNALTPRGLPESAGKLSFTPGYMKRTPKNGKNKNNNDNSESVKIQVTDIQKDIQVGGTEIQFEKKVTQILVANQNTNKKNNKKRKDSFSSASVNVVIQVVQTIVDVSSNSTRYAMQQLLQDNGSNQTSTAVVTNAATYTVGNGTCNYATAAATDASALVASDGTATATAVMALQTDTPDVGAPFIQSNGTALLPSDASAPEAPAGATVYTDPAADTAQNQTLTCGV